VSRGDPRGTRTSVNRGHLTSVFSGQLTSALTGRYPPQAGRTLRRLPRVAMMEAADHRGLDDPAFVKALHRSWLRGVLLQGQVCSGPVVVDEVLAQQATQMGFVQHHDVVETLAAEGADEPFHVRILPRRPRRRLDFVDPHGLGSAREHDPVHRIAVAQEVSRGSLPGAGLHELLGRPLSGGASVTWCRNARFSNTRERWVLTPRRRPVRMRVIMPAIIDQAGRKSTLTRRTE
jgi:hypothetical protein